MPFGDDAVRSLLDATLPLMQAPPVNLGVICRWLGIEVYAQPCRAFGALFLLREGRGVLLVNSSLPQGRARFSIAHELGHLLLRHNPLGHIGGPRDPDQERQADRFGSCGGADRRSGKSYSVSWTDPRLRCRNSG